MSQIFQKQDRTIFESPIWMEKEVMSVCNVPRVTVECEGTIAKHQVIPEMRKSWGQRLKESWKAWCPR